MFGLVGQENTHQRIELVEMPGQGFMVDARGLHHIAQGQVEFTMATHPAHQLAKARKLIIDFGDGPPLRW